MSWDKYQWITAKIEAEKNAKIARKDQEENEKLGYQVDADIHEARAEDWEKIAELIGRLA